MKLLVLSGREVSTLARANEAIDALKCIRASNPYRQRGFQIVTDWIRANRDGPVLCNPAAAQGQGGGADAQADGGPAE